jgi:hypothetical protein
MRRLPALAVSIILLAARPAAAQHEGMDHAAHMAAEKGGAPTSAGQAAYAVIAEVVRALEADPRTDWSKVDIDALRRHLVDMDEVTLRSAAVQRPVDGGIAVDVTGTTPRAAEAVARMARSHAAALDADPRFVVTAQPIAAGGVRFTVRAEDARDLALVARIRGLGFYGLLTVGDHHAAHHLMLARGENHS